MLHRTSFLAGIAFFMTWGNLVLYGQISGRVFRDYNANGLRDSTAAYFEPGVPDVQVIITGALGNTMLSITNEQGHFEANPVDPAPYRVEFAHSLPFDFSAPAYVSDDGSGGAVQFIMEGTAFLSYGINYPADHCADASLLTPCYVMGDPLDTTSAFKEFDAFVKFPYSTGGKNFSGIVQSQHGGAAANLASLGTGSQIGSCWGVSVQRSTGKIYTSAALKRHAGIGPLSYGGLYQLDMLGNSAMPWIDLNSIGVPSGGFPDNAQRMLPVAIPPISTDSLAYSQIGKISYGGMDISDDDKTLYIVSLYTRKLYSVFIDVPGVVPGPEDVDSFDIPDPGCTHGTYRPWAVKVHRGVVYLGVVCDASHSGGSSSDLSAYVYAFHPSTATFEEVLRFPLDYPAFTNKFNFNPWIDVWNGDCPDGGDVFCQYPQPVLSDIDFDGDDVMVLGIMDRYSMQGGINQHDLDGHGIHTIISFGDILRARYDPATSTFALENNANDGFSETAGKNTGFGPGGGEYYFGDHAVSLAGLPVERESVNGAVALCPGYRTVATTCVDPFDQFTSGIIHLNNQSGDWDRRYVIIPKDFGLLIGKGNALGDIDVYSQPPPIEIGNYVWADRNGNSMQDPSEPPIPNVVVELLQRDTVIATAFTNAMGQYLFSNGEAPANPRHPLSMIYGINALKPESDYQLRIAANHPSLAFYTNTLPDAGVPANDQTDSDGHPGPLNTVVASVRTGINGQNDHSFDFGFIPQLPCTLSIADLAVTPCNPLTGGYDLHFQLNVQNGPVGDLLISLSTGENRRIRGQANGNVDVLFSNLKAEGISQVGIHAQFVFDALCVLDSTGVFDQPVSCCPSERFLCENREGLIQLLAPAGMQHYTWRDSTTQTTVGNSQVLLIDKDFAGLSDGYEAYYFEAIDTNGDTLVQHCRNRVAVIPCCALQINTFIQTECNNNNTVNDPSDDWFAVLVSASNPDAGPSSTYEVLHKGKLLETVPYGSHIVVGMAPDIDFLADGTSIYKLEIRDSDQPECLDSAFTVPSSCPRPQINVRKELFSNTIQSDASHTIVYRIEVENQGSETGSYTLTDAPAFDDDIVIQAAFYTTNILGKGGSALLGTGPWTLVSNQLIGPGFMHVVYLTVNVRMRLDSGSPGDQHYSACSESLPTSGQGLFNRALLDIDGDNSYDLADTSCTDIPFLEIEKSLRRIQQTSVRNYQIEYLVTVSNRGGANGTYNLVDRPSFDDDVAILQASYASNAAAGGALPTLIPVNGWVLANNASVSPGSIDSFRIFLSLEMDLSAGSTGDNAYRKCGTGNPLVPRIGEGLFNYAGIDLTGDFRPEKRDTTCDDLPQVHHEKTLLSQTHRPDGSIDLLYLVRAFNLGGAAGTYTLHDFPLFEDDAVIREATYSTNNGPNLPLDLAPGVAGWQLAGNRSLAGFGADSFLVSVNANLDYATASPGDNRYQGCNATGDHAAEAGNGLFNESVLDVNADGIADQRDTVCTDYGFYDLALRKVEITSTTARNGDFVAFRIAVYNQGSLPAFNIRVLDYLPKTYTVDPLLNAPWTRVDDSTLQTLIPQLAPGDSALIDLIVRVFAGFNNVHAVINAAEIAGFETLNTLYPNDIDSAPDDDRTNDNPVLPDDPNDNKLTGHRKINPAEDEDDHDVATTIIFDLALRKKNAGTIATGFHQKVDFQVWVYNQGNIPSQNITLVDYIPRGFAFHAADNPSWTDIGNEMVTSFIPDIILPGDSLVRVITLELLPANNPQDYVNMAEVKTAFIVTLHHILNILQDDFDSVHDMIIDNDAGGQIGTPTDDHIEDDGNDANGDGITDEDDKDPATAFVWDLALKKVVLTPKPHNAYQDIEFGIWVYNQGTDTAGRIWLRDYPGNAFVFESQKNPGWTQNGSLLEYDLLLRLVPGDSVQVRLILHLTPAENPMDYINYAEITASENAQGVDRTGKDFDSREASDGANERLVKPGNPGDDDLLSSEREGNEDDHDPASPSIFDLALSKYCHAKLPVRYGDTLPFSVTIVNQGLVPVSQINIADHLPEGLRWVSNPGWTYDGGSHTAGISVDTLLFPGDSVHIGYFLKLQTDAGGLLPLENIAEISGAIDNGGIFYTRDFDGFFDVDKSNDAGGRPFTPSDNFRSDDGKDSDGDGIADEDDHDPAVPLVHDLALRKYLTAMRSDTAVFRIAVYNQGNVPVSQVVIADYLNTGYQWLPGQNPGWTQQGGRAEYTIRKTLAEAEADSVEIQMLLLPGRPLPEYYNWAEIIQAIDTSGLDISLLDADSRPGSDADHERSVIADDPRDNDLHGGGLSALEDEDDHDVAGAGLTASLGNLVWHDRNGNGIQDKGEEGIAHVRVDLCNADTREPVQSQLTNADGYYLFVHLFPGRYFVKFTPPEGYSLSRANAGNDAIDSDGGSDNGTNATPTTELSAGEEDLSLDQGLYKCVPISGYVWLDNSKDGIQQIDETGINGLSVYLYRKPGNVLYAKTKTYSNNVRFQHDGYYQFCAEPGSYYIRIPKLNGFILSPALSGNDPTHDSDFTQENGPWTTRTVAGLSCDVISDLSGAVFNPSFGIAVDPDLIALYQEDLELSTELPNEILLSVEKRDDALPVLRWQSTAVPCPILYSIERSGPAHATFELLDVLSIQPDEENTDCVFSSTIFSSNEEGLHHFRIRGMDKHQRFVTSNEVSTYLKAGADSPGFSFYPNPAYGRIYLQSSLSPEFTLRLSLRDAAGREILSKTLPTERTSYPLEIELADAPPGWYTIELQCDGVRMRKPLTILR
ncbi:MAG: hypothetical protein KBH75_08975 [Saprospiraceae bacterium]|nr:hypothetical protein [Saprospiraceae bacterium]